MGGKMNKIKEKRSEGKNKESQGQKNKMLLDMIRKYNILVQCSGTVTE
jgi:hypothetical protein